LTLRIRRAAFIPIFIGLLNSASPLFAQESLFGKPALGPGAGKPDADLQSELNGGKPIKLTQKMIDEIAAQLGIDGSPKRKKSLAAMLDGSQGQAQFAANVDLDESPETPRKILRHIRGTEGIPFPTSADVELPFTVPEEEVKKQLDGYFRALEGVAKQQSTVPQLPACAQNKSDRAPTNYTLPDQRNQVLLDMLFIRKEDLPLDPKEIFGNSVMVRPYSTEEPNVDSLSALGVGIQCLPTRLRVTRAFTIRDEGRNALKNYDKDPNGPGEFHITLKEKFGEK
jgi:hypothetical protein